ncbi:CHAP domain-containing protein [uncultured Aquimarina sp.]|uniref:CHAP domain-containing protein n=1 Tax=uncultured Aquimarina sp. TaxID=575652 RepID=UPI0026202816|nr:CHAP domain-containing protein [uncultured Aquimarina sp.]
MSGHNQETINAALQLIDARSKRIEEINRNWADYANQTTLATNEGEETLQDAYFAERKEEEVSIEGNSDPVIHRVGETSQHSTLAGIAGSYTENPVSYLDIATENGIEDPYIIHPGQRLVIPNQVPTEIVVNYMPVKSVTLGSDTYIVVKGFALQGKEATIQVFEKNPFLLMEAEDTPLTFLEYRSLDPEGDDLINENQTEFKAEFNDKGEAIVKIQLRPKKEDPDTVYLEWQEKFIPEDPLEDFRIEPNADQNDLSSGDTSDFILDPETENERNRIAMERVNGTYTSENVDGANVLNFSPNPPAQIIDPLWLLVKVVGDNATYERRFPEERGEHFRLEVNNHVPWMEFAWQEEQMGVSAWANGNNPRISEYFGASTNGQNWNDNTNWCGAYVSWCIVQAGFSPPPLSARAAFWQFLKQLDTPIYGAIAVRDNGANDPISIDGSQIGGAGHVTFIVGVSSDGNYYFCLGGNQGGASGERNVQVSRYRTTAIDWFVVPHSYNPSPEEYELPVYENVNDFEELTDENTRNKG